MEAGSREPEPPQRSAKRERERSDAIMNTVADGIYQLDLSGRFVAVNDVIVDVTGYSREELLGSHVSLLLEEEDIEAMAEDIRALVSDDATAIETRELLVRDAEGRSVPIEVRFTPLEGDGEIRGTVGVVRDISDRKKREREERERERARYETTVETIWDGVVTLDSDDRFAMVNEAFCEMTGYDREELLGERATLVYAEAVSERAATLSEEVLAGDITAATLEFDLLTADGDAVPVEARFGPYPHDGDTSGRTAVIRDITDRAERERELEQQREQLTALNNLNGVIRELNRTLVRQSTREEIEALVCEQLTDSDSYLFAWIGELSPHSRDIRVRTEAGVEDYLDGVELSVDSDDPLSRGPTGRAFRTGEMQVCQDILTDPAYEPWRKRAHEYGYRSSAAIPVAYEGTLYGVLNVYSARPFAFYGEERDVVGQLGGIVGHAINAIERKQALMSDEVIELEFQIENVLEAFGVPEPDEGRIVFERAVHVGDEDYLEFGTATESTFETLEALVERVPHFEKLDVVSDEFGEIRFELHTSEPPATSAVASHGGRIRTASIEDGSYRMVIELPPAVESQRVVDAVRKAYPSAVILAHRRTSRRDRSVQRVHETFVEGLTDRQRATLETAYFAGFFEWPRDSTGEEIADSMNVSPSTFHKHLRKGEEKLFGALFV